MNNYKNPEMILLIEDNEDHAFLIRKSLKEKGRIENGIYWVKNGQEGLDYVYQKGKYSSFESPGLILLDVKMPIKGGFEVLEELKSHKKHKKIPIVMLTTTSNPKDVRKALEMGANDYIVKPVRFEKLAEKVGNLGKYWLMISDSKIGIF